MINRKKKNSYSSRQPLKESDKRKSFCSNMEADPAFYFYCNNDGRDGGEMNFLTVKQLFPSNYFTCYRNKHFVVVKQYVVVVCICYQHWFSLSQPLRLVFFKHQKDNNQALRRIKLAKFCFSCSFKVTSLHEKQRTIFKLLLCTLPIIKMEY